MAGGSSSVSTKSSHADAVHCYTAAIIQATVCLRLPGIIMADDIREDFETSFDVISQMSKHSKVAQRALPMLLRIKTRLSSDQDVLPVMPWEYVIG